MSDEIARMIKVNADTLPMLGKGYGMKIHGDYFAGNVRCWDLEFPTLSHAVSFAEMVNDSPDVLNIEIRYGDVAKSLYDTITLTLFENVH